MNLKSENRSIFVLILTIILLLLQTGVTGAAILPNADKGMMDKITSIVVQNTDDVTALIIQGNGKIPDHTTRTIRFPPRIIIDILHAVLPFKSISKQVSSPTLTSLRVGYHPKSIRLVLDANGPDVPHFSTASIENRLVITLHSDPIDNSKHPKHPPSTHEHEQGPKEEAYTAAHTKTAVIDAQVSKPISDDDLFYATEQLTEVEGIEDQDAISTYVHGIDAYKSQNWLAAVNSLTRFLESTPADPYAEKALFLIAKASDQLYSESLATHFNDLKRHYEDAIYRYPQSIFVPDAYLSVGNLCFRTKLYSEALGYFNLVIELDKHVHATLQALMLKAKLFSMKDKREEALAIYRLIQQRYPGSSEVLQAKIETAKIFFEMNQFHKSLNALSEMEGEREYLYQNPDLFRYFGDNYYQLGNYAKAKEHLFRYYNIWPGKQDSHLILARIADAYREEGISEAATKYYQLVLERYPDTEGALISMYRIADQQEKGEIKKEKEGVAPNFKIIGNDIDLPRTIYETVIQSAIEKDEASPLTQFALLKLSILDRKEKKYTSSINILKNLVEKYPRTKLRKEIELAFEETLLSILEKDYKVKKYKHIINTFQAEKTIIANLKSPPIFIIIARAALHLNLEDMAIEMFENAASYTPDERKPPDLLFYLATELFENNEFDVALSNLELLIKNHPEDKTISEAFLLKGKILSSLKKYAQASEMFSSALRRGSKRCEQPAILIQQAKALIALGFKETAYQAVSAADKIVKDCIGTDYQAFEDIATLYVQFGYPQEALSVIKYVHDMDSEGKFRPRLKLLMARCYEMLNNKQSYLAIYNDVMNQNDPFWGNVAKEKMEEMSFNPIIRKGKK